MIKPNLWLDQNKPVEQITWAPGEQKIIRGRMVTRAGWVKRENHTVFNLYRPPLIKLGDAAQAGPWLNHIHKIYPDNADHIIKWCAHRMRFPHIKINHMLVLGGAPGIGKDTMLEPVKRAVGDWNCAEISPMQLMERWNDFVKSVLLTINEARDRGEMNQYEFYEHTKAYAAAPPNVLRCDEKNHKQYYVFNLCGVIITTNYKDGLYLPANDRRHYFAWAEAVQGDFSKEYWDKLWAWYDAGGDRHVAAYLAAYDLSGFNPKVPPPKTAAFWAAVDANRAPEESEFADVLETLGNPKAVALSQVYAAAQSNAGESDLADWLRERKNRRAIPHRFAAVGYTPVRNEDAKDGYWKIYDKRQPIYAKADLPPAEQIAAATNWVKAPPPLVV